MASEQNPPDDMSVDVADNTQQSQDAHSPLKGDSPMRTSSFDALLADLKERPHNPDGWRQLVEMAEQSGEAEKIRTTFDILLKQYPNTVRGIS
jgi:cleavage stimulation factor subunit 3